MQSDREPLPRYVLDTDTITYEQQGRQNVTRRLSGMVPGQVTTTVVNLSEQMRGRLADLIRVQSNDLLPRGYERFLATHRYYCGMLVLPFDAAALSVYQTLVALRLRIGTQDLRIAAITLANDAILVTSNRRDFERVPDLRVEDWNAS